MYSAAPHRFRRLLARLETLWPAARLAGLLGLTAAAVLHLALALGFPAGRNDLLGANLRQALPYLTYLRAPGAFGFPDPEARGGFIRYTVYTEGGTVHEGFFPDRSLTPELRYQRWAAAGDLLRRDRPALHRSLLDYLLTELPAAPIKLELFAAEWIPGRTHGDAERPYRLRKLGTHDGLTREWTPVAGDGSR